MNKTAFIPKSKRAKLNSRYCSATSAFNAIIEMLESHLLPSTTEEVAKALQSPSYLRDQAVAEAEAYATKTKAPASIREDIIRKAFESVNPALVQDLSKAVAKWVAPFKAEDFERDDMGQWSILPSVHKSMEEAITIEVTDEDMAEAERLRAFCAEYMAIDKRYGFNRLTKSIYNAGSAPIEEFIEFVVGVKS
ncbi:MAG: hypothetical protein SNF68_04450 [Rikenellaceae bacterium]